MNKLKISDFALSLILTVVVLITGTVIAKSYELLKLRFVIIGGALTACIFFIMLVLVLAFVSKQNQIEFERTVSRLKELIPPTNFPWLYSDTELAKAESEAIGDSIWIISPDLSNVIEKSVITDTVKKNIKRGITYTYIVPTSDRVKGKLPRLEQIFGQTGQLKLRKLTESRFKRLSVTHIAIFNAGMSENMPAEAFLELPIEEVGGKKIRGYWVKLSTDAATDLIGRFSDIVKEA